MRILIIGGFSESLVNFRGPLLQALVSLGHSVFTCASGANPTVEEKLRALGVAYHSIHLSRAGMNPLVDILTLFDLLRLMRRVRPDMVLTYTIKPVIYGALAAALCGVPATLCMITGLGYAFNKPTTLGRIVRLVAIALYRVALVNSQRVFFFNPEDQELFLNLRIVRQDQVLLTNGSGVDVDHFGVAPLPPREKVCFLLIARLLRDKGVGEYVAAARMVRAKYPQTKFLLVGDLDPNPSCISQEELKGWILEGVIEYLGYLQDVRPAIAASSVYVLPSYYEGTPRSVMEAMAMGRPIITTDAPGCRETIKRKADTNSALNQNGVVEGENGFLVPVKDAERLAYAMEQFILQPELLDRMGTCSRAFAVEKYDVHKINAVILEAMGIT